MEWSEILAFGAAMFTITNPIGNAALFLGMVEGMPAAKKRQTAVGAAVATAVILVVTVWLGERLLDFFGVSIPALESAGGLIIAMIGLSMLQAEPSDIHSKESERNAAKEKDSIAVVPLAMPIIAGPGTISTVLVATHKNHGIEGNLIISGICVAVAVIVGVCFLFSAPMARMLGHTGINILTRFMGLILTAIAIGMLASGLSKLLPGLAS